MTNGPRAGPLPRPNTFRRPATSLEQHRAKRRSRPFRLAELGAWAGCKSQDAGAVTAAARIGGNVPLVVHAAATLTWPDDSTHAGRLPIDWRALLAAGHRDPRGPHSAAMDQLQRIAAPLVRQAFAAGAGRREGIVLVTSAAAGEGRTFVTISLALGGTVRSCWSTPFPGRRASRRGSVWRRRTV